MVYPEAGSQLTVGQVTARVVHPAKSGDSDLSLNLSADVFGHGAATVLFSGDAEQDVESSWFPTTRTVVRHAGQPGGPPRLIDLYDQHSGRWRLPMDRRVVGGGRQPVRPPARGADPPADRRRRRRARHRDPRHRGGHCWCGRLAGDVETGEGPADEPESDCVDLNSASHERLQDIIYVGPDRATAIIDGRPWGSAYEFEEIDGIGPSRMQDIHDQGSLASDSQVAVVGFSRRRSSQGGALANTRLPAHAS